MNLKMIKVAEFATLSIAHRGTTVLQRDSKWGTTKPLYNLMPLWLTCVVIAAHMGCSRKTNQEPIVQESVRPILSIIARKEFSSKDAFSGIVEARYTTELGFRMLGRIVTRHVSLGEQVVKGQILATLESTEPLVRVRTSEAALEIAKALGDNASKNFDRQMKLLANNASSPADYEAAKKATETAQAAIAEAQAALKKSRQDLTYTELRSEIDGVVTAVYAEAGETVSPGQPVFEVADPLQLEAVIDVPEEFANFANVGTKFNITLPPLNIQCGGSVREIAPQADAETKSRRVRIAIENPPEMMRLGATIKALPITSQMTGVRIPNQAILERNGEMFVWIVDEKLAVVNRAQVTIASRDEKYATVMEGVSENDRVVIVGVHSLTDGQAVRVDERESL